MIQQQQKQQQQVEKAKHGHSCLETDFQLPEGYQLAEGVDQVTNIQVPFGATAGHTMIVEAVPSETVETVLNVTFETIYGEKVGETTASTTAVGGEGEAWTFMLGTDFQLPEGYQLATGVDQVTNIQIPFGAIGGHTMIVEPIPAETVGTVLTITFETVDGEVVDTKTVSTTAVGGEGEAWTFMLGDRLPASRRLSACRRCRSGNKHSGSIWSNWWTYNDRRKDSVCRPS